MSHTTLHRWLGFLGAMAITFQAGIEALLQADPTSTVHRFAGLVDPSRARTQKRLDAFAWQAFRVSLMSPLITGEVLHEDREAYFQNLAKVIHHTPDGPKSISVRTFRRWYQTYREHGIDGLKKRRRSDLGQPRQCNQTKVNRAEAHKRELATRSDIPYEPQPLERYGIGIDELLAEIDGLK